MREEEKDPIGQKIGMGGASPERVSLFHPNICFAIRFNSRYCARRNRPCRRDDSDTEVDPLNPQKVTDLRNRSIQTGLLRPGILGQRDRETVCSGQRIQTWNYFWATVSSLKLFRLEIKFLSLPPPL